ncbi:hypothetical protein PSMK_13660 [Phycisphaera mikurensis NBRC 102666]|uniref:Glycosyltransferase 61 catalytic domain-containing protein n=1 Tax=Phycisphaera mikurensis (strain NBRC 102666 / KCTC 22515 / FYK2301M01) TaxID=1142394 RepID=I0IE37_PHYMF|nr:hypothetical protein PSMK_13660 [Phycisphaera mikurensis NBRC 102666]
MGAGLPARAVGWRGLRDRSLAEAAAALPGARLEEVHPPRVHANPLPRGVGSASELPADAGWWGYAMADVPARAAEATQVAELGPAEILWYRDPEQNDDFFPAIVAGRGSKLRMREVRFRPRHERLLMGNGLPAPREVPEAVWFLERVWHNHSHWLAAHLPKLLLLRGLGRLKNVLLPARMPPAHEASLRLLGLPESAFLRFDEDRPLRVGRLTALSTDRFAPELVGLIPRALALADAPAPTRRVWVSRERATRRRLLGVAALHRVLDDHGFERVVFEELDLPAQAALMRETGVLAGPHGAGLTNMLFAPRGLEVVELADPGFPNPNFYALGAALGHRHRFVPARPVGDRPPVEQDLAVEPGALAAALATLEEAPA